MLMSQKMIKNFELGIVSQVGNDKKAKIGKQSTKENRDSILRNDVVLSTKEITKKEFLQNFKLLIKIKSAFMYFSVAEHF